MFLKTVKIISMFNVAFKLVIEIKMPTLDERGSKEGFKVYP